MTAHDAVLRSRADTTMRSTVDRIVRVFELATDQQRQAGARWYDEGGNIAADIAAKGGITREHAAVVLAHLSPQTTWQRNVAGAYGLVTTGHAPACLPGNVARATAALQARDPWLTFSPTAPKTLRFARNLLGATDVVTVDTWATRVALGSTDPRPIGRVGVYEAIEYAYQRAARRLDLAPTHVQATTWIVARNGRVG